MSGSGEYVQIKRAVLAQLLEQVAGGHEHDEKVRQAGVREGQAHPGGYREGYARGHDTGFGAQRDDGYVAGILEGHQAGTRERQELAQRLLHQTPQRGREAELEAGS